MLVVVVVVVVQSLGMECDVVVAAMNGEEEMSFDCCWYRRS